MVFRGPVYRKQILYRYREHITYRYREQILYTLREHILEIPDLGNRAPFFTSYADDTHIENTCREHIYSRNT